MKLNEKVITIVDWLETRHDAVTDGKASRAWYIIFVISVPFLLFFVVCKWMFDAYKKFFFAFKGDPTIMQSFFVIFTAFIGFLLLVRLGILLKHIVNNTM